MPQQVKRARSQREPTKNFDRYPTLQEQGKGSDAGKEEELEGSDMSLFMDFVQAAASQRTPKRASVSAIQNLPPNVQLLGNLNVNHQDVLLRGKGATKFKSAGVRNGIMKTGASTSKGSRPWTPAEEHDLMKLVKIYGNKRWSYIAQLINGRTGKQCRERWLNHLRPNIKKDEWTAEEERILAEGHSKLGTKWSSLAKLLPGRTENSIKNHWNATLRCKGRLKSSKGSSRGNKPGVLKEYMDSLQRGLTAEKAVEIACFAEKLSTALAKEQPNQNGSGKPRYDASAIHQEVSGLVSKLQKESGDTRQQLLESEARFQEQRKKTMKNSEHLYLTKRHMPHIDEWSFQYSDLGADWAWYWKLHNNRAHVKIIERPYNPTTDYTWPFTKPTMKKSQDAMTYTCVGKFDKGISTSQYNSRALQCVLSACVFVVQRNEEIHVEVSIYLSKDGDQQLDDTLVLSVYSNGIGKTTGLQEMLRQIKTVLTLTANNENAPPKPTLTKSPAADAVMDKPDGKTISRIPGKKTPNDQKGAKEGAGADKAGELAAGKVKVSVVAKPGQEASKKDKNVDKAPSGKGKSAKKSDNNGSDSETISEPEE